MAPIKPKRQRAKRERPVPEQKEATTMSLSTLQAQGAMSLEDERQMAAFDRINQASNLNPSSFLPNTTRFYPSDLDLLRRNYQTTAPNPLLAMQREMYSLQGQQQQQFYGGGLRRTDSLAMSRSALLSALAMDQSQPLIERRTLIPGIADMAMPGAAVGLGDSAHAGNVDLFYGMQHDESATRARSALHAFRPAEHLAATPRVGLSRGMMELAIPEAAERPGSRELVTNTRPSTDDEDEQRLAVAARTEKDDDGDGDGDEKDDGSSSSSSCEEDSPSQSSKKRGAAEPFPEKLHRLIREVERSGQDNIISFTPDGKAFMIHKPEEFFSSIVPRYFKQSRFSSFKRQLNLYGFETVTSGPNKGAYNHENFVREDPDLCRQLKRRDVKFNARPKSKLGFDPDAPDFYSMPPIMTSEEAEALAEKKEARSSSDSDEAET